MHDFLIWMMRQRKLHRVMTRIHLVYIISITVYTSDSVDSYSVLRNIEFVVIALIVWRLSGRLMHVRWLYYTWMTELLSIYNCIILSILISMILIAENLDLLVIITVDNHVLVESSFVLFRLNLIVNQVTVLI